MEIYVADLAEYNAGRLYGKWLDLDDFADAEELKTAVYSVPKINPYSGGKERNKYAIHDYALDYPHDPDFGEYPDLDDVFRYHELCCKYGEAFAVWYSFKGGYHDRSEWEDCFNELYCGEFDDYAALAEHFVREGLFGEIPDNLTDYIDYEKIGRDPKCEYTIADGYCFCVC